MLKVLFADGFSPSCFTDLSASSHFKVLKLASDGKALEPDVIDEALPEVEALVVRARTKVTAAVLEVAPHLKYLIRAGTGLDNIDCQAAAARGITVVNTPYANAISVAELVMGLLLSCARKLPDAHASMVAGAWEKKKYEGVELLGRQLGVIGYGRIGREVALRAMAFGMRVVAFDPFVSSETKGLQGALSTVPLMTLEEVLRTSDSISLHVPLVPTTRHLLNAERLALLPEGAWVIHCARGGVVDEQALADAVKSRRVGAAACDVFEEEPLPESSPLRNTPGIYLTPHLGASTREAQMRATRETIEHLVTFSLQQNSASLCSPTPANPLADTPYLSGEYAP